MDNNAIVNALMQQQQQQRPGMPPPQAMSPLDPMGGQASMPMAGGLSSMPMPSKDQQGNGMLAGIMDKIFAAQMSQQAGNTIQGGMM